MKNQDKYLVRQGAILKQFRCDMAWQQIDVADLTGYNRSTVSQFESGSRPVPKHILVLLLALKKLDVEEINEIFEEVYQYEDG